MNEPIFPIVTGEQMAAVDTAMVEVCGLELVQVMEVAGRAVAIITQQIWRSEDRTGSVVILCGSGGNGGDGFVCGKYLTGWNIPVELWLVRPSTEYTGLAEHQLDVCRLIGMTIVEPDRRPHFDHADLIVDGLFGFGLSSAPRGRAAELITAANDASAPVIAIDIPSGIDSTSGEAKLPAIRAGWTITLGLPKLGLLERDGPDHTGTVIVADIGIPDAAYAAVGIAPTDAFQTAEFTDRHGQPWSLART